MARNEKLFKIYFKKLFFQNVLVFIDHFCTVFFSYCIIFETNIFIKMVICVAFNCKRDENLKQWFIKIKRGNIRSIQHVRMCYALAKIPAGKRYHFNWP